MNIDYIALSVPVFFILIGIELAYALYKNLKYYRFNDSISNLSQGIGSQLTGLFMKTVLFLGYQYIFTHWRLFDLPHSWWVWLILFVGVDFFYYWFHRLSHQVNALWAAHIVHHQSEEYNLTVALRQSWFQSWFSWIFYLPLAFIGFDPLMFVAMSSFNTLYQFWIHTRAIKNLGILEYIINTPSHHRVHHGSNPKYIDKNHGGTLIIWDILFGTFQKEEEEVYYGITKPLASWNPLWANFHYWVELWGTAKKSTQINDKISVFLKPPGWYPKSLGGFQPAPEIDIENYRKYDDRSPNYVNMYIFFQFLTALGGGSALLFWGHMLTSVQLIASVTYILLILVSCGALFEKKKWLRVFEFGRLGLGFGLILLFNHQINAFLAAGLLGVQLLSLICFFYLQRSILHAQKISGI